EVIWDSKGPAAGQALLERTAASSTGEPASSSMGATLTTPTTTSPATTSPPTPSPLSKLRYFGSATASHVVPQTHIRLFLPNKGDTMSPPRILMEIPTENGQSEVWQYLRKESDKGLLWEGKKIPPEAVTQKVAELETDMQSSPTTNITAAQQRRISEALTTSTLSTLGEQPSPPAVQISSSDAGQEAWRAWYAQWLAHYTTAGSSPRSDTMREEKETPVASSQGSSAAHASC